MKADAEILAAVLRLRRNPLATVRDDYDLLLVVRGDLDGNAELIGAVGDVRYALSRTCRYAIAKELARVGFLTLSWKRMRNGQPYEMPPMPLSTIMASAALPAAPVS